MQSFQAPIPHFEKGGLGGILRFQCVIRQKFFKIIPQTKFSELYAIISVIHIFLESLHDRQ